MGGAVSKSARKLPTKPRPSWAGATTQMDPAATAGPSELRPKHPEQHTGASESRTEAIEQDSRDPHFMANLSALGQVKVDHHMATFQTSTRMRNILRSQQLSEQQASSSTSTRNRIVAASMIDALEERKYAMSQQDLGSIAKKYDLDVDTLENVARTVMSPSILEGSRRTIVDEKNGEERVTMTATWMENHKLNSPAKRV